MKLQFKKDKAATRPGCRYRYLKSTHNTSLKSTYFIMTCSISRISNLFLEFARNVFSVTALSRFFDFVLGFFTFAWNQNGKFPITDSLLKIKVIWMLSSSKTSKSLGKNYHTLLFCKYSKSIKAKSWKCSFIAISFFNI